MKKLIALLAFMVFLFASLRSQPVSEYRYKLDNGISIRSENTWSHVWVQQAYSPIASGDLSPVTVTMRSLGDLISGSTYNLMNKGKEVKMKGAAPGTYDLKMAFKLSGKPGTLSFVVGNVLIKPKTKTSLTITLYDYQIIINESALASSPLAGFETEVLRCKASTIQNNLTGVPSFYLKENHNNPITPDESTGKTKGKIKPGTYDLMLSIGIAGKNHKVWLENFQMKAGTSYKIITNLNAGGVIYTGGNKDVKAMHLYPAGTAATQTGAPAPLKNLETMSYTDITNMNCCSPGSFDILLNYNNGKKYEWRKNIAITTGTKTEIK